jgi:hypothetical protein
MTYQQRKSPDMPRKSTQDPSAAAPHKQWEAVDHQFDREVLQPTQIRYKDVMQHYYYYAKSREMQANPLPDTSARGAYTYIFKKHPIYRSPLQLRCFQQSKHMPHKSRALQIINTRIPVSIRIASYTFVNMTYLPFQALPEPCPGHINTRKPGDQQLSLLHNTSE